MMPRILAMPGKRVNPPAVNPLATTPRQRSEHRAIEKAAPTHWGIAALALLLKCRHHARGDTTMPEFSRRAAVLPSVLLLLVVGNSPSQGKDSGPWDLES